MDPTISFSGAFQAPHHDGEGDALRPLDWTTLVARLGAERDLRRELAHSLTATQPGANFACGVALLAGGLSQDALHDARDVNPEALANRKSTGVITRAAGATAPFATHDARGQQ